MHTEQVREMFPPRNQNTVGVCNQITVIILYYRGSWLVIFLKIIDAYKQGIGPGVALWLRHCGTNRTVPGSIPGGVT